MKVYVHELIYIYESLSMYTHIDVRTVLHYADCMYLQIWPEMMYNGYIHVYICICIYIYMYVCVIHNFMFFICLHTDLFYTYMRSDNKTKPNTGASTTGSSYLDAQLTL